MSATTPPSSGALRARARARRAASEELTRGAGRLDDLIDELDGVLTPVIEKHTIDVWMSTLTDGGVGGPSEASRKRLREAVADLQRVLRTLDDVRNGWSSSASIAEEAASELERAASRAAADEAEARAASASVPEGAS